MVQIIPQDQLEEIRIEATERVSQGDPGDWPAVAAALQLGCPVWTEDEDFFGSGVATWTTGTVEIFFRGR
jgi:predicted nucleic acid-binding protein